MLSLNVWMNQGNLQLLIIQAHRQSNKPLPTIQEEITKLDLENVVLLTSAKTESKSTRQRR